MRTDTKNYYDIPQAMKECLVTCGYKSITPQDQSVFDPYFDKMNEHWSSGTCFSTMIAWKDVFPILYKIEREFILGVAYLRPKAKLVAIPFIGFYTEEKVNHAPWRTYPMQHRIVITRHTSSMVPIRRS